LCAFVVGAQPFPRIELSVVEVTARVQPAERALRQVYSYGAALSSRGSSPAGPLYSQFTFDQLAFHWRLLGLQEVLADFRLL